MTHEPDFNELTAFVERRLDDADRERVIAHLSTCRTCREVVAALTTTLESRVPTVPAWSRRTGVMALAAMLVVVVVVVGVMSGRRTALETRPPDSAAPAPTERPATPSPSAPSERPLPGGTPVQPGISPREDLQRLRGAERQVGGKTFRFIAGEWVDAAYDPLQARSVIAAASPSERADLLRRVPGLKPYAALGARVTVVFEGTVYKLGG